MTQPAIPDIPGYRDLSLFNERGGMGVLYRGYHEKTGEEVIIKLMNLAEDSQEYANSLRRFTREIDIAKIVGAYTHEHVLAAIDHGELPVLYSHYVTFYLVYPYIKNGSLSKLLEQEEPWCNWPLPLIADVIVQAAEGLSHLHKHKIVHQDVKPKNFLWSPANSVQHPLHRIHIWLIDFGAAEWEGETQFPIGTLGYIAPEQRRGHIRCSADQYSLAAMARYLLTGYSPPPEEHLAHTLYVPPTQLNSERLHEQEIDRVVLKALAQSPEDRFGSVREFAEALQRAILQQEHVTFYMDRTEPLQPPSAQQHTKTLSLHQAPSTGALPINPPPSPTQQVAKPPPPTQEAPLVIPPILSSAPYQPVNETLSPIPQRHISIPNHAPSLPSFPLQKLFTVQLPSRPTLLAWSPDGTALVCTFHEDVLRLIHNDQKVEMLSGFAHGHCACWSPNSRFLAISIYNDDKSQAQIRLWNRTAPKERYQPLQLHNGTPIYGLDWSSTGLLAAWIESELFVHDLSTHPTHAQLSSRYTAPPLSSNIRCDRRTTLRWSPDGIWLAAGANNGKVICWSPHTPALRERQSFIKSVSSVSWSPDSKILVTAFANKQVMFWDLRTGSSAKWAPLPDTPTMVSVASRTAQLVVATKKMLFFGRIGDPAPTASSPGQQFAAWSSTNKLATLDKDDDTTLVIWQAS